MCQHRVLLHNENGYIVQCNNCQHFQIGFGTTMMYIDEQRYRAFQAELLYLIEKHEDFGLPNQKNIHVSTCSPQVYIILNFAELQKLNDMIQQASLLLAADRLLAEAGEQEPPVD